jgi:hypothetical protein
MRNRVIVPARHATWAGGIHSLESIPGPHKHLKIRAQLWGRGTGMEDTTKGKKKKDNGEKIEEN